MKKILVPILILMFFVISCSSSKKAENDADILPDEDAVDEDAAKPDKEQNDEEELEDDAESSVPDN